MPQPEFDRPSDNAVGADGATAAWVALPVGMVFAMVSAYWGLGGTWLVDTVAGALTQGGGAARGYLLASQMAAVLKVVAAVLPLVVAYRLAAPRWRRPLRVLAWTEAGVLILYGLVLTGTGLLVQADVLHASVDADHRALAWHTYLWDPWFLLWGAIVAVSLTRGRSPRHA